MEAVLVKEESVWCVQRAGQGSAGRAAEPTVQRDGGACSLAGAAKGHPCSCPHPEAVRAVYPQSRLQRCIVHKIRSSTCFVSWKDIKQVVADLKKIVTLDKAEENLLQF